MKNVSTFLFTEEAKGGLSCSITFEGKFLRTMEPNLTCVDYGKPFEVPYFVVDHYKTHCPFHDSEPHACVISRQYDGPNAGKATFCCCECGKVGDCTFDLI